jgi:hypothetical protein
MRDGEMKGPSSQRLPDTYGVRVKLTAPYNPDSEWLEFGFAKPGQEMEASLFLHDDIQKDGADPSSKNSKVEVISVCVDGVPVKYEKTTAIKQEMDPVGDAASLSATGKEWATWLKVFVGSLGGGEVMVDYVLYADPKGKGKAGGKDVPVSVFLPTFGVPVCRLEVFVEGSTGKRAYIRPLSAH